MKKIIAFVLVLFAIVIVNNSAYSQSSDSLFSISNTTYKLKIDYMKKIGELISDCNLVFFSPCINDKKPSPVTELTGLKVKASAKLFHFNRYVSDEDVITKMNQAGYRPATIFELLAFAKKYHKVQKQSVILALSSIWNDDDCGRIMCGLYFDEGMRKLDLFYNWEPSSYSFLGIAVRK